MKTGTKLGILALVVAVACAALWFYQARQVDIPENRTAFVVVFLAAAALGVAAFVKGTSWLGGVAAVVAIFIGSFLPFTVSTDHPDEIQKGRRAHGLQARMLSDPDLVVTDAFGLRNQGFHSAPLSEEADALPGQVQPLKQGVYFSGTGSVCVFCLAPCINGHEPSSAAQMKDNQE